MTTRTQSENARREPGEFIDDDAQPFSARERPLSSPRALRLLATLIDGPATREGLDRRIGASNSPDVVMRLRQRGFDLPCELREVIDRDGRPCRIGVYRMTARDHDKALHILDARGAR